MLFYNRKKRSETASDVGFGRKIAVIITAALLCVVAAALVFTGCGHKHDYVYTETVAPSCKAAGVAENRCSCGETEGAPFAFGEALGHDYDDGVCLRCSASGLFEINDVQFVVGGSVCESYVAEAYCGDIPVSLRINGGADLSGYAEPEIVWSFVGESYGSAVSADGVVTLGEFIGGTVLSVTVGSGNSVTAELPFTVVAGESLGMDSLVVTLNEGYGQTYKAGQIFDADSIAVWGEHKNGVIRIYGFQTYGEPLTPEDTDVAVTFGELRTELPILVEQDRLLSVEVVTQAERTEYLEGQKFAIDGLTVRAVFENSSRLVTDFEVDTVSALTLGTEHVTVSYSFDGVTVKTTHPVTVLPKRLSSVTVDSSNVRNVYTRGDVFNPKGLVITAYYEGFDEAVELEYTFDGKVLSVADTYVEITYTPVDEPVTERVAVTVIKPYTEFTQVKVLSPADVSLTWKYTYVNDDGERVTDDTAYEQNGLRYDRINGVYDIPLGATVTAYVMNPAVINLALNGFEQTMNYEEKTVCWVMGDADIVAVASIEMGGAHSVIRFAGQDAEQSFLYEGSWNGFLSADDLARLSLVFADSAEYRHVYTVNGEAYGFEQLKDVPFGVDTCVTVIRNAVGSESKEVVLHLNGGVSYNVSLDGDATLQELPVFTLSGYEYGGWSLTEDGERITEVQFADLLADAETSRDLYIVWIKETVDYSDKQLVSSEREPTYGSNMGASGNGGDGDDKIYGSSSGGGYGSGAILGPSGYIVTVTDFVGEWSYTMTGEGQTWTVKVTFCEDGRFVYTVIGNDVTVCEYTGEYRLEGNAIIVISVATEMEIPLIGGDDFGFLIDDNEIEVNMVVFDGEAVMFIPCVMTKGGVESGNGGYVSGVY